MFLPRSWEFVLSCSGEAAAQIRLEGSCTFAKDTRCSDMSLNIYLLERFRENFNKREKRIIKSLFRMPPYSNLYFMASAL